MAPQPACVPPNTCCVLPQPLLEEAQVIMGAFFAVGAPSALLVGWLGDRCNRVLLLFGVVGVGRLLPLLVSWHMV